jgi:hypothetical protein
MARSPSSPAPDMKLAGIVETADPAAPHLLVGTPVMGVTVGFVDIGDRMLKRRESPRPSVGGANSERGCASTQYRYTHQLSTAA